MAGKQKAALGFIFITVLIDVTGFGIIIPVLPKLIQEFIGGTISDASRIGGLLLFAFSITQFFFAPILGGLSDQYGRRAVLLISLLGFGLDYALMAVAPSLAWLFLGRVLSGAMGASFTTAAAYIADISTPDNRSQNYGLLGAAFGLGFILGPVIGGLLGQFGPRIPFVAAAILCLVNWLYGYFVLPESLPLENRRTFDWKRANPIGSFRSIARNKALIGLAVVYFFVYLSGQVMPSTWSYFTMERFGWGEDMVGYSLGFVGILLAIVQGGLIRVVIPKIGQTRAVFLGLFMYMTGLILCAMANQGWMMFAFMVPYCLGGFTGPALQGILSTRVEPNAQGELQGGLTSLASITSILGPLIFSTSFSFFTSPTAPVYFPGIAFAIAGVFMFVSLFIAVWSLSKKIPQQ